MIRVPKSLSEVAMKDGSFVAVFNSVLRYAVSFTSEYKVTITQARAAEVVEDIL